MRLVCGRSAHATCVTHNSRQERLGQRSRKLAGRRNVGSLLKPCGLAGSEHPGRWGVRSAAERGAPLEGGSATTAATGAATAVEDSAGSVFVLKE